MQPPHGRYFRTGPFPGEMHPLVIRVSIVPSLHEAGYLTGIRQLYCPSARTSVTPPSLTATSNSVSASISSGLWKSPA